MLVNSAKFYILLELRYVFEPASLCRFCGVEMFFANPPLLELELGTQNIKIPSSKISNIISDVIKSKVMLFCRLQRRSLRSLKALNIDHIYNISDPSTSPLVHPFQCLSSPLFNARRFVERSEALRDPLNSNANVKTLSFTSEQ